MIHSHMIHSYIDYTWLLLQQCLWLSDNHQLNKLQGNKCVADDDANKWNNNLKFLHGKGTFNILNIYKSQQMQQSVQHKCKTA